MNCNAWQYALPDKQMSRGSSRWGTFLGPQIWLSLVSIPTIHFGDQKIWPYPNQLYFRELCLASHPPEKTAPSCDVTELYALYTYTSEGFINFGLIEMRKREMISHQKTYPAERNKPSRPQSLKSAVDLEDLETPLEGVWIRPLALNIVSKSGKNSGLPIVVFWHRKKLWWFCWCLCRCVPFAWLFFAPDRPRAVHLQRCSLWRWSLAGNPEETA